MYKKVHGRSSFRMHDPKVVFDMLALKQGDCVLDLGCGPGDYSLEASVIVGDTGTVYALDSSRRMVETLIREARARGVRNIRAMTSDITGIIPIADSCVDVCLMSTVFHIPAVSTRAESMCAQIRRVLKPGGCLAVIECKKEDMPFGPPMDMRWSPEEMEECMWRYGFRKSGMVDLGYNYMILFTSEREDMDPHHLLE